MLIMVYLSTVLGFLKPFFLVVAFVRVFIFMFLANSFWIVVVGVYTFAMEYSLFFSLFFFCWFQAIFQFNSWICTVWFRRMDEKKAFLIRQIEITTWTDAAYKLSKKKGEINKRATQKHTRERAREKKKSDLVSQLMSILVLCLFLLVCSFSRAIYHSVCTQNFVVGNELAFSLSLSLFTIYRIYKRMYCLLNRQSIYAVWNCVCDLS